MGGRALERRGSARPRRRARPCNIPLQTPPLAPATPTTRRQFTPSLAPACLQHAPRHSAHAGYLNPRPFPCAHKQMPVTTPVTSPVTFHVTFHGTTPVTTPVTTTVTTPVTFHVSPRPTTVREQRGNPPAARPLSPALAPCRALPCGRSPRPVVARIAADRVQGGPCASAQVRLRSDTGVIYTAHLGGRRWVGRVRCSEGRDGPAQECSGASSEYAGR